MWQSDWTEWQLSEGRPVAIAGTLDDHSRLLVGITAGSGDGTGELVWAVMAAAIGALRGADELADRQRFLLLEPASPGYRPAAFEANLAALGCQSIASTPYHPQTCGKIERFWQTLKKWLRARERHTASTATLDALNKDLALFAEHYNTRTPPSRPERAHPGRAFAATVKARPLERPLPATTQIYRTHVSTGGTVTVADQPAEDNCTSTSAAATNSCPSPCSKTESALRSSPAPRSSEPSTSTSPRPTNHLATPGR